MAAATPIEKPANNSTGTTKQTSTPPNMNGEAEIPAQPIKIPFTDPTESAKPPSISPLTDDQSVKYHSLLSTVASWTTVPTTEAAKTSTAPITDAERMWLTRECLLRYLRAARWSVNDARSRLLCTLGWRREYGVEALTAEYIGPENETGKQVINGYDVCARPCLYLNPAQQNTSGYDKQIQQLVFSLERCSELMVPGQEMLCILINFKSIGKLPSTGQGRQALHILQAHYPERMGKALIINMPWLVWGFMKLITPFIDPTTREKLKYDEDLRNFVPPSQLVKAYGGDVDFEYDHDVYWPALNELAARRKLEQMERWAKAGKRVGEFEGYIKGGEERSLGEREEGGEVGGGKDGVGNGVS